MFKKLLTAATLVLAGVSAQAAEFGVAKGGLTGRDYITITGEITYGDAQKLERFYYQNLQATHVAFHSPGGVAQEGYLLGNMISQLGLKTAVTYGNACISACYIAFLGGYDYEIKGVLAAHVAWTPETDLSEGVTPSSLLHRGQAIGSYDAFYHLAHGFSYALPYQITQFTSKNVYAVFTHEDQLNAFYARNEVDAINDYLKFIPAELDVVNESELTKLALKRFNEDYPDWYDPREETKY